MKCAYCKAELHEDEPHVKVQHHERGSYVLTNYFCSIEHQIFRTLKGRYGISEEKMHELMGR
jgi:hypothetical protein